MSILDNHFSSQKAFSRAIACNQEQTLEGVQILLVEDEPDMAELLTIILEGVGADVVGVTQAGEALEILKQQHSDVLVCNIKLPDRDGDWLIRQIRSGEGNQHIPAIAVTSYTREVCQEHILKSGFERYLSKIADPDELVSTVASLVKHDF